MNLAVALLRMAPQRFELSFKKIYHSIEGPSANKELTERGIKALYYLLIKKAKIENITLFLKDGDDAQVTLPSKSPPKKPFSSTNRDQLSPSKNDRHAKSNGVEPIKLRIKARSEIRRNPGQVSIENLKTSTE